MKAFVYEEYGGPQVLKPAEIATPVPGEDEALIKVHATAVTSADIRLRSLTAPTGFGLAIRLMLGFSRPRNRILGTQLAGEIVAVGRNVTKFRVGDQVFGTTGFGSPGTYAQYVCTAQLDRFIIKPSGLSFQQAAAIPFGATTALYFIRDKAKVHAGQKVLIYGASGNVGTFAVQLARYYGADVTGVCSAPNLELVKSLGAQKVIDYTKEDFTQNGETYDVIFDTVGKIEISAAEKSLKNNGCFVMAVAGLPQMMTGLWKSLTSGTRVLTGTPLENIQDLAFLTGLVEDGTISTLIDRVYPFEKLVEAHSYVDTGRKKGSVIISIP